MFAAENDDDSSANTKEELTSASLERHSQRALNESKLKNILSFLDEVETGDRLQEIDQVLSPHLDFNHYLLSR